MPTKYRGFFIEGDKPTFKRTDQHHIQYKYRGFFIDNCTVYHSGEYNKFTFEIAGKFYKVGTLKEALTLIDYKLKHFEKFYPNID